MRAEPAGVIVTCLTGKYGRNEAKECHGCHDKTDGQIYSLSRPKSRWIRLSDMLLAVEWIHLVDPLLALSRHYTDSQIELLSTLS